MKKCNILIYILILIAITSYVLPKELNNLDEVWIYNTARNVANGLMPYKDFNLVTTPLLPLICGLILKITVSELFVMRILAIILITTIIYLIYKILDKLKINTILKYTTIILITYLLKDYACIDYNFINLLLILVLIDIEIKQVNSEKNSFLENIPKKDILIGIIAGLILGFKQTTGIVTIIISLGYKLLLVKNKKDLKTYLQILKYRAIGSFIPILIISLYLLLSGTLNEFISYAILGVKTFDNKIPYSTLFENNKIIIKALSILAPLTLLYMFSRTIIITPKNEKQYKLFVLLVYSIASCVVIYPISDEIHFLTGIAPIILAIVYIFNSVLEILNNKIKLEKLKLFIKEFLKCGIIVAVALITIENIRTIYDYTQSLDKEKQLAHYNLIPISDGIYESIVSMNKYIENQEKDVYILDATAAIYMIPMDKYNKNFDMFLKGNLGDKGQEGIIEEIKGLENVQLLIKDKPRNWQTPEEVIEYVETNWQTQGKVMNFTIYEEI